MIAGQTKCLLSVYGSIKPIRDNTKGTIALVTGVLGRVYLLEGL